MVARGDLKQLHIVQPVHLHVPPQPREGDTVGFERAHLAFRAHLDRQSDAVDAEMRTHVRARGAAHRRGRNARAAATSTSLPCRQFAEKGATVQRAPLASPAFTATGQYCKGLLTTAALRSRLIPFFNRTSWPPPGLPPRPL